MGTIYVVGLGPGDGGLITEQSWQYLEKGLPVYLRTEVHPSVDELKKKNISYKTFDYLYNTQEDFSHVYGSIVEQLQELSKDGDIVYAVPGSPMVAEQTVVLLREKVPAENLCILTGMSFLEVLYTKAGIDPVEGLFIVDSADIEGLAAMPPSHVIVTQLYSRHVASEAKISLMKFYDDEAEVTVVHHMSLDDEKIETIPLYELDHLEYIDYLTSLVIHKNAKRHDEMAMDELDNVEYIYDDEEEYVDLDGEEEFAVDHLKELVDIMAALRGPGGCPWDKMQTHASLRHCLLEEAYEVIEAINDEDGEHLCEELGDILLQVVFHSQIAKEKGDFTIDDVIDGIVEKMIRRHPHVFGEATEKPDWEALKEAERGAKRESIMDGIPKGMSAMLTAQKIEGRAQKVGFYWDNVEDIWAKIDEEIAEFKEAVAQKSTEEMEKEGGDMLFSLISLLEWYKISGENALQRTNHKFLQRFSHVESMVKASGKNWSDFTLDELDAFWVDVKKQEKY